MSVGAAFLLALAVFATSLLLTALARHRAEAHGLLDQPNFRSSHTIATPRGGGVAIALVTLGTLLIAGRMGWMAWGAVWSIVAGGALVSVIGLVDDAVSVAARWRLVGQFIAASWVLAAAGGVPPLEVGGYVLATGSFGGAVCLLYLVWMTNVMNFMDGIDGLAGVEAVTVCLGAAWLGELVAPGHGLWTAPLVVASATLGFLAWNWPPAKIFMGDAGSGFLGVVIGALSLHAAWVAGRLFWIWMILLGVFVVDATFTLARRVLRGERFFEGHRSHGYQHAARKLGGHLPVTARVAAINVCWLFPIALVVALGWLDGFVGVLLAYAPLAVVAARLRAGTPTTT